MKRREERNLRQWIVRQTKNMKTRLVTFAQQIKFWNLSFNNNDEVMVTFSLMVTFSFMLSIPISGKRGWHSNDQCISGLIPYLTGFTSTSSGNPDIFDILTSTSIYTGHWLICVRPHQLPLSIRVLDPRTTRLSTIRVPASSISTRSTQLLQWCSLGSWPLLYILFTGNIVRRKL